MTTSRQFPDCVAYYDPNALPVSAAQEIVRQWAAPRGHAPSERVSLFDALDRVLAEDVDIADRRAVARQLRDGRLCVRGRVAAAACGS